MTKRVEMIEEFNDARPNGTSVRYRRGKTYRNMPDDAADRAIAAGKGRLVSYAPTMPTAAVEENVNENVNVSDDHE